MNDQRRGPVAVLDLDLCPGDGAAATSGARVEGAAGLLSDSLRARVEALAARCGVSPAHVEVVVCGPGDPRPVLARLAEAVEAVSESRWVAAAIVAPGSADQGIDDPDAILLIGPAGSGGGTGPAPLALIRALARPASGSYRERFPLLLELCAGAAVDPRALTLLSAHAPTLSHVAEMRDAVLAACSRQPRAVPHCTFMAQAGHQSAAAMLRVIGLHALAVRDRVLPPTGLAAELRSPWCGDARPRPWIAPAPRRAAGWMDREGWETAVLLEECPGAGHGRVRPSAPLQRELIVASADDRAGLAARLDRLADRARQAGQLSSLLPGPGTAPGRWRAALLASDPADLAVRADRLAMAVRTSSQDAYHTPDGLFFGVVPDEPGRTALLFPGQGSQFVGMFGDLCLSMPGVQEWFEAVDSLQPADEPFPAGLLIGPPSHGLASDDREAMDRAISSLGSGALLTMAGSIAMAGLLERAGLRADGMAGYSNGENAALVCAGVLDTAGALPLMRLIRLHDLDDQHHYRGDALAVSRAPRDAIAAVIDRAAGSLFLALDNCPEQVVLFGQPAAIGAAAATLSRAGAICARLPFAQGHHTPLFASRARQLRALYSNLQVSRMRVPLYSCVEAAPFPSDPEAARDLAADQWARPVRFGALVERLYADGFRCFVEAGPGSTLTGFVRNTLRHRPHVALTTHVSGRPGTDQLLHALGRLFVLGHDVDAGALRDAASAEEGRTPPAIAPGPRAETDAGVSGSDAAGILAAHFRLMDEFLQTQARTHALFAAAFAPPPVERSPLLGDVSVPEPGRLDARRVLDPSRDVFLWHHALGVSGDRRGRAGSGLPVVPFACSVEIAVEAAAKLAGWAGPAFALERIRGRRWIVPGHDPLALHVRAEQTIDDGRPAVRVTIAEEGASLAAFEALVRPGAAAAIAPPLEKTAGGQPRISAGAFNDLLFHGPLFRSLTQGVAADDDGVTVEALVPNGTWFADGTPADFRTPMSLVDLASQIPALWLAHHGTTSFAIFPFSCERCDIAGAPPAGTPVRVTARARATASIINADLDLDLADGTPVVRIRGLQLKLLMLTPELDRYVRAHDAASRLSTPHEAGRRLLAPPDLQDGNGLWLRVLAHLTLTQAETRTWSTVPGPQRVDWLLDRLAAKEVAQDRLASAGHAVLPNALESSARGPAILISPPADLSGPTAVAVEPMPGARIARAVALEGLAPSTLMQET